MNEQAEPLPPVITLVESPAAVALVPRKGWTKLSWLVILSVAVLIIGMRTLIGAPAQAASAVSARLDLKVMQLQVQSFVAIKNLNPGEGGLQPVYESVKEAAGRDPAKGLRVCALAPEAVGPESALKQLDVVEQEAEPPFGDADKRLAGILRRLYRDQMRGAYHHPSVTDDEAEFIEAQLGWFGKLALYASPEDGVQVRPDAVSVPPGDLFERYQQGRVEMHDEAVQSLVFMAVITVGVVLLLGLALIGLPLFLLLWLIGVIRIGLRPGIAHGGIYAETFAIWLVLYVGMLAASELLLRDLISVTVRGMIAMPLSLVVVAWPVLRGVPWRQVRQDIGWTAGHNAWIEPACGLLCYIVNLPIMVAGFMLTVALAAGFAALQREAGGAEPLAPTHPVLEQLSHADWPSLVPFFIVLSVVAPLVEETMFRGFLHRHLRDVFFQRHPVLGGLCTALVVNLIFAALHPQGLIFVPVLTALACAFSLAREWRNTLIPAMVAHGMNNFLVGLMGVLLLSR